MWLPTAFVEASLLVANFFGAWERFVAIFRAEVCVTHSEVVTSVVSDFQGSFSN